LTKKPNLELAEVRSSAGFYINQIKENQMPKYNKDKCNRFRRINKKNYCIFHRVYGSRKAGYWGIGNDNACNKNCNHYKAKETNQMTKCKFCKENEVINENYTDFKDYRSDYCSECNFWSVHMEKDKGINKDRFAVIKGIHYVIGNENVREGLKGGYGNKDTIKFNDGRIIETTNLRFQGRIPGVWLSHFPNNAVFIK